MNIAIYVRRLFLSRNHLFSSRKYDLALADFERRSGSVRPAFEAYLARGLVSLDRGDTVAAFKDFNFAVKAGPKSAAEETVVRRSGVEINMRAIGRTSDRPGKRQAEGFLKISAKACSLARSAAFFVSPALLSNDDARFLSLLSSFRSIACRSSEICSVDSACERSS